LRADRIANTGVGASCRLMDLNGGVFEPACNAVRGGADRFSNFVRDCIQYDCLLCE
jgi:hypothetical protein